MDEASWKQERPCTCHPDDNPPVPCPGIGAYSECVKAAARILWYESAADEIIALNNRTPRSPTRQEIIDTLKGVDP